MRQNLRTDKHTWFLDIARRCAQQGTCRRRNYGAVIVDDRGTIVSTGYTGAPSGCIHCLDCGSCWREKNNIPSGTNYDKCRSVHAEMNAIIQAGKAARGSNIYITGVDAKTNEIVVGMPCFICAKIMLNSGLEAVFISNPAIPEGYAIYSVEDIYNLREKEAFSGGIE